MAKRIVALVIMLMSLLVLAGCDSEFSFLSSDCDHEWEDATCRDPKTCKECGKTKGEALDHEWEDATCAAPKTCKYCGKTKGKALDHEWEDATCTDPKTCKECGATEGEALGHNWSASTCTDPSVCLTCGESRGTAGHDWIDATCRNPKTCRNCGKSEGGKTDHDWVSVGSDYKYCTVCGLEASGTANNDSNSDSANNGSILSDVSVGDTVVMGYYGNEAIEWIVLDYDPSTNRALLISKYCLDAIPYHAGSNYGSWENCTLRRWLNNSFINQAFTQEEQAIIASTHLSNPDNPDFDIDGGKDTVDRIFLLSYEEAVYYFPAQESRKAKPTDYCLAHGCFDHVKYAEENDTEIDPEAVGYTWWWLRTPGITEEHACNVLARGAASSHGGLQTSNEGAVRPAMWIQLG